jgi:prepilin-type N-terminal cleavage/methylation domain-containing protein
MHQSEAGFTLIEMMVVMAIIGLMAVLVIPSVSNYFQVSLTSTAREMASTVKEAYNATVVTGQVHRLVYDLKENSYWVEIGPANVLLETEESRKRDERKRRFGTLGAKEEEEKKSAGLFVMNRTVTRKKISLPTGVTFEDVKTQQSEEPITEGKAYTHFFPHGMIEQTIVHLKDNSKHQVSLVLAPIIGKTDMYNRYLTEKEAFGGDK